MTFVAYQTSGANVTSWLRFNPASDEFLGIVPASASGTIGLAVIATDAQHLTVADMFNVTFASGTSHNVTSAATLGPDPTSTPPMSQTLIALHS